MNLQKNIYVLAILGVLAGCGGGGGGGGGDSAAPAPSTTPAAVNTYTVGGSVSGLSHTGLVLANGSEKLAVAAGGSSFVFAQAQSEGANYSVVVDQQPAGLSCSVQGGAGTVAKANINGLVVACTPLRAITGTVAGLSFGGLSLLNGAELLNLSAGSSSFAFTQKLAEGSSYGVTIRTQPSGQGCVIAESSGTVGAGDVSSIKVSCSTNTYTLGGSVSGLNSQGLTLKNGTEALTLAAGQTSFSFTSKLSYGTAYSLSVASQPQGQNCAIANSTGTITADTSALTISCVSTLAQGAENLPSLASPQAGSTAALRNGNSGIYTQTSVFLKEALIAADGTYVWINSTFSQLGFGKISFASDSFTVSSGDKWSLSFRDPLTGAGVFVPFTSVSLNAAPDTGVLEYSRFNALAVEQAEMAGTWAGGDMSLIADANGQVSGTTTGAKYGGCSFTGSLKSAEAGSKKNLFKVALRYADSSACKMLTNKDYVGMAYVSFYAVSTNAAEGYKRQLSLALGNDSGWVSPEYLKKQ